MSTVVYVIRNGWLFLVIFWPSNKLMNLSAEGQLLMFYQNIQMLFLQGLLKGAHLRRDKRQTIKGIFTFAFATFSLLEWELCVGSWNI